MSASAVQRRPGMIWTAWVLGISLVAGLLDGVVSFVFTASNPPPLVAIPLGLLSLVALPGALLLPLLGGVHNPKLPAWAR